MAKDGKRASLPKRWPEIRAGYESGRSILSLSKEFGVHRNTINNRRTIEQWSVHPDVQLHSSRENASVVRERTQAQVIDLASRRAVEQMSDNGSLDRIVGDIADIVSAHGSIARRLNSIVELYQGAALGESDSSGMGRRLFIDPSPNQSHADVFAKLTSGIQSAIATTRDIAGLRPGQSSFSAIDNSKKEPTSIVWADTDQPEIA